MKVKIGDYIYDPNIDPIMVIFSEEDKENIKNMHEDKFKYICYPDSMTEEELNRFKESY